MAEPGVSMLRDALVVAGKDLRIEARSRVATNQVAPFAVVVLVLFGLALDPDRGVLFRASAGLFWVTVLLAALLSVQRSYAVEASDAARDALRLSGMDPAGIFLGKATAVAVQLLALQALLALGIVVLYDAELGGPALLLASSCLATVGLAAAGTLYGALAAGLRARETLLPFLLLPVVAPVLLGAARAWESALGLGLDDGWRWVQMLGVFAVIYVVSGVVGFGSLLEDA